MKIAILGASIEHVSDITALGIDSLEYAYPWLSWINSLKRTLLVKMF